MPESSLAEDDEPMESPDPVQDGPAGAVYKEFATNEMNKVESHQTDTQKELTRPTCFPDFLTSRTWNTWTLLSSIDLSADDIPGSSTWGTHQERLWRVQWACKALVSDGGRGNSRFNTPFRTRKARQT